MCCDPPGLLLKNEFRVYPPNSHPTVHNFERIRVVKRALARVVKGNLKHFMSCSGVSLPPQNKVCQGYFKNWNYITIMLHLIFKVINTRNRLCDKNMFAMPQSRMVALNMYGPSQRRNYNSCTYQMSSVWMHVPCALQNVWVNLYGILCKSLWFRLTPKKVLDESDHSEIKRCLQYDFWCVVKGLRSLRSYNFKHVHLRIVLFLPPKRLSGFCPE